MFVAAGMKGHCGNAGKKGQTGGPGIKGQKGDGGVPGTRGKKCPTLTLNTSLMLEILKMLQSECECEEFVA